jgi:hypothetical protein
MDAERPDQREKKPSRTAKERTARVRVIRAERTCIRYLVWSSGCVKQAAIDAAAPLKMRISNSHDIQGYLTYPSQKGSLTFILIFGLMGSCM